MEGSSAIGGSAAAALFTGPGEMRARCREIDWAATPLGPVATWAPALCAAVRLCLDSGFPMCVHAGPAQLLLYNDAYVGTFDAERHPWALGRPAREVWEEVWDAVAPAYAALLAGGSAEFRENAPFVIRRNGALQETFWTYSRSPIRDADGAIVGILAVGVEVTARARAEAARDQLLADERLARLRAEALQALAAELARAATPEEVADAVVTRGTAATATQFGLLLLLDAEGKTFTIAAAPGATMDLLPSWRQFPNGGDIPAAVAARTRRPCYSRTRAEYVARGPGLEFIAERFGLHAEAALPLVVNGRVIGVLSFEFTEPRDFDAAEDAHLRALADLCAPALERARLVEAERARIAAEAARAEAEAARTVAEAANRAKDDLLAVVSHELRAPLAPMRAIAQALARTDVPTPEVREMAAEIDRLIVYEARLIDDLLDYQRASRNLLALQRQRCDLHEIAHKALRVVGPLHRAKRMPLTEELAAVDPVVWADPMRVQQIIYNLLANAVKFSAWRTPIVIRTRNPAADWIELEVVDHGEGIAPDVVSRLFEPFTQAAPHRHPNSGLGLGLALSRQLAELYGGTLSANSEGRGRGATFTLRLPTARAVQPALEVNARPIEAHASDIGASDVLDARVESYGDGDGKAGGATPADRPLRILVIDDDPSAARALRRRLSLEGHVVHLAANLATAERIAGAEPLDVVLADLQLGMESGLAAPRRLAEAALRHGRAVPASIVLSGYDRDSDVAQSRMAGFVAHLAKPVDDRALLLAVQRAADSGSNLGG